MLFRSSLKELSVTEAKDYIASGEFGEGSMLPKVEACLDFIEHTRGDQEAIITSLTKAKKALEGKNGTHIKRRIK